MLADRDIVALMMQMNHKVQYTESVVFMGKQEEHWFVIVDKMGIIGDDVEFNADNSNNNTTMSA
jgi:hypothetical protein